MQNLPSSKLVAKVPQSGSRRKSSSRRVDTSRKATHTGRVYPRIDPTLFLAHLNKRLAASGLSPAISHAELVDILNKSAPRENNNDEQIVDPIHGLPLPPKPSISYRDRAKKYGRNISLDDFLELEGWNAYRRANLLCSAFILQDKTLYRAFTEKARWKGITTTELMREYNILTRDDIVNPKADTINNVRLIQAALVGLRRGRGL